MKDVLISIFSALVIIFLLAIVVAVPVILYAGACMLLWGLLALFLALFGMEAVAMELVGLIVLFVMAFVSFKIFKSEILDK